MIDIIIPFYNPRLDPLILRNRLEQLKVVFEDCQIILVNDGSGSLPAGWKSHFETCKDVLWIDRERNSGKGAALRTGLAYSTAPRILLTDVDVPFDNASMCRVAQELSNGKSDVVLGVRDKSYYRALPPGRRLLSRAFNVFTRVFFGRYVGDTQAGLKGLNTAGKRIYLQTEANGFLADFSFVRHALRQGLILSKVSIRLEQRKSFRPFGQNILWRELGSLLRILRK